MLTTDLENEVLETDLLTLTSSWDPDEEWSGDDEEDDEDFDDRAADLDDLHEIQVEEEDFDLPDPDDDDHLPDDDE